MVYRILAWMLMLLPLAAQPAPAVRYLPTNTYEIDTQERTDGLVFYFDSPTSFAAEITVEAIQGGRPIRSTQTIDTDRTHGERLIFRLVIDPEFRHELIRVTIAMGGTTCTLDKPRAGVTYDLKRRRVKTSALIQ